MSCLVAFHYRSYGTFFLHQNKLHNIHRGFTHYKYYRAFFRLVTDKPSTLRIETPINPRALDLLSKEFLPSLLFPNPFLLLATSNYFTLK